METFLIIDAHALIHRFFHALPPLTTPQGEPIGAVYGISVVLMKILREVKPTYAAVAFDRPEKTFRAESYTDYKIQRPQAPDALISQFGRAREAFTQFHISIFEAPRYEADDVIGTLVERFSKHPNLLIMILTGDFDLLQLVNDTSVVAEILTHGTGNTKRFATKDVMEKYDLSPHQLTDYKGLVGDVSDNIPGVKGIGPKTARELLKEFGTLEEVYENVGLIKSTVSKKLEEQKNEAFLSKKLATIQKDVPITIPSLEELRVRIPDTVSLSSFFTQLGFVSLVKRLKEEYPQ